MPKISTHGGPSIADTEVAVVSQHTVEVDPAPAEPVEEQGVEDTAAESNSGESTDEPNTDEAAPPAEQRRSRGRRQNAE